MDAVQRAFARALEHQFIRLGRRAIYLAVGTPPKNIRVIARRPEQRFELGEQHFHAENPQFEFRVSEIKHPKRGDKVQLDAKWYRLEAEPQLELHQLIWSAPALPV